MLYQNPFYRESLKTVSGNLNLEKLKACSILITGASGMIGSCLVDLLMYYNETNDYDINVFCMGRKKAALQKRFQSHLGDSRFHIIEHDVKEPLPYNISFDYMIHAASNAYPLLYSTDPVGTIMGNVWGGYHLLEYARQNGLRRFLFVSTGEVYGQGAEDITSFDETYSGFVESLNPRSCYPNAKRLTETLCASYMMQYGIDTVIARPCHTYGPTAAEKDNRASSQFIRDVLSGNDIVMKSQGLQLRSYCYVADCASAILAILLYGKTGNAYNIANSKSNITIGEMAEIIAQISGKKVIYNLPNELEKSGYNPVTQSVLNPGKLEALGWEAKYDMKNGLLQTMDILKKIKF